VAATADADSLRGRDVGEHLAGRNEPPPTRGQPLIRTRPGQSSRKTQRRNHVESHENAVVFGEASRSASGAEPVSGLVTGPRTDQRFFRNRWLIGHENLSTMTFVRIHFILMIVPSS
jgi:hypothetical protein